jgi:hypothetical protein
MANGNEPNVAVRFSVKDAEVVRQALAALGKDRGRPLHRAHRFQQNGNILRAIFSIGIHDDDGITPPVSLQIGQ